MFSKCAPCHRPGGVGPFPLLTFEDVFRRRKQIAEVTASRYMPPWLPEPQELAFADMRRLSDEQQQQIADWIKEGAPEGHGNVTPPIFPSTWFLGKPDVEMEMPEGFPVPEEGTNVFRNFVLPVPIQTAKYVAAYEVRPDPIAAVHHAVVQLDPSQRSRELDAEDPLPGFPGMVDGRLSFGSFAKNETSQVLGWTPGKVPRRNSELAWRLNPGTDLILQLHLQPLGHKALERAKVGLYFTDQPPLRPPFVIFLSAREIDILPGEKDFVARLTYKFPVDVELRNIYPHAHFVCKSMRVTAALPDGSHYQLIHIPDWDFNWHDDYNYAKPVTLPAGTEVQMEYHFDNSADNPQNPHQPPQRIQWGEKSVDEMADLALLVVPRDPQQLPLLQNDYVRFQQQVRIDRMQRQLESKPNDAGLLDSIGEAMLVIGRPAEGVTYFRRALDLDDNRPETWVRYGLALQTSGRGADALEALRQAIARKGNEAQIQMCYAELLVANGSPGSAVEAYEQALRIEPTNAKGALDLARLHLRQGAVERALDAAQRATTIAADSAEAWRLLALIQQRANQQEEAAKSLTKALRCDPSNPEYHFQLGEILFAQKDQADAEKQYEAVLIHSPNHCPSRNRLGIIAAMREDWAQAEHHLMASLAIEPEQHDTLANLARAYAQQGRLPDAIRTYAQALDTPPILPATALQYAWLKATASDPSLRDAPTALKWARYARDHGFMRVPRAWDVLAASHALAGEFEDAKNCASRAINLLRESGTEVEIAPIELRRKLYEEKKAFVEINPTTLNHLESETRATPR